MRQAKILYKDLEAGLLTQFDDGSFAFKYSDNWLSDSSKPAVSLTLPKVKQEFRSAYLFPFFYNLLPEGSNKQAVCLLNRIDPDDDFGILLTSAKDDAIGAVRVVKTGNQ